MESYSVQAIISAIDTNYSSTMTKSIALAEGFQKKFLGVTKKVAKYTALASAAAAGYAFKVGSEFEAGMSEVGAISKASQSDMVKLTEKAKEMGKTTVFSARESAEAMKYMAMAGWDTQKIIGGLPGVMNLAAASGEDLGVVSDIVTDSLTAFKMEAKDAGHFADVLAMAATSTNTNVSMLGESFKYVAPIAGTMGYKVEDVGVALGLMANAGIKSSMAGTSLRSALQRLNSPTSEMISQMDSLGISLTNSDGTMKSFNDVMGNLRTSFKGLTKQQKLQAASTIFGTRAAAGMLAVIDSSDEDFNKLTKSMNNASGAAEEMANKMLDNLQGDTKLLQSAIEGLGIAFSDTFNGAARKGVQTLTEFVNSVTDSVEKLGEFINKFNDLDSVGDKFDLIMDKLKPIAPLLAVIGAKFTTAFAAPQIAKFTKMFGVGINQMLLAPTKIRGVGKSISSTFTKLSGMASKTMGGLIGKFDGFIGKFPPFENAYINALIGVEGFTGGVKSKIAGMTSNVTSKLSFLTPWFNRFGKGASMALGVGGKAVSNMTRALALLSKVAMSLVGPAAILGLVVAGLGLLHGQFGEQIDKMVDTAITQGPQIIQKLIDGIVSKIPDLINEGSQLVVKLADAIVANLPVIIQGAVAIIGALVGGISSNASQLLGSAIQIVTVLANGLISAIPQLLMMGMDLLLSLTQGILDNMDLIIESVTSIIENFVANIESNLPQIIQTGIQILMNLVTGLVQLLPALIPVAAQAIVTLVQSLVANIPMILDGAFQLITGLANGLFENLPLIISSAGDIILALVGGLIQAIPMIIAGGFEIIMGLAGSLISHLPDIVAAGWELIKALAVGIAEAIPNLITGAIDGLKGIVSDAWDWITGKTDESNAKMETSTQASAENVVQNFGLMEQGITTSTSQAYTSGSSYLEQLANSAKGSSSDINSAMTYDFSSLENSVIGSASNTNSEVVEHYSQMASGSEDEIQAMTGRTMEAFKQQESALTQSATATSESVTTAFDGMSLDTQSILNSMGTNYNTTFKNIGTTAQTGMSGVSQTSTQELNKMKTQFNQAGTAMSQVMTQTMSKIKSVTTSGLNALTSAWASSMTKITSLTRSQGARIIGVYNSIQGSMRSAGYNAGMGFYYGLAATQWSIMAKARAIAYSVSSTIRSALSIHSPSRVMEKIGGYTGMGFAKGIDKTIGLARSVSGELANAAIPSVSSVVGGINSRLKGTQQLELQGFAKRESLSVNLNLGSRNYKAFVDDISSTQTRQADLELAYLGG